jgi:phosphate transport system protein
VMEADDEIDRLNFDFRKKAIEGIKSNPERIEDYLHLRTVSQNLERIADQATNIAEDVVYLCTGEIIRHHADKFNP